MLGPVSAFALSLLFYTAFLGLISLQTRVWKQISKQKLAALVNLECLIFFGGLFYILGAQQLFPFETGVVLYAFLLYLGALGVFYSAYSDAENQIRFTIPFALPFLLFTLVADLMQLLPPDNFVIQFFNHSWMALIPSLLFLGVILIFLPLFFVWFWNCVPLEESDLKERLDAVCEKAHFAHAGLRTWGVMDNSLTAAIIGVVPSLRYILFTKKLLKQLSPSAVEAVLAHEIGHSFHKHMLIYPLIFFGLTAFITFFLYFFTDSLYQLSGEALFPLLLFLFFALSFGLYFRYVFGFFSRLFERQADLHVFALGIAPEAMIEALDYVGVGTGFTHLVPNWHHYSIQERIDFLKRAIADPSLVPRYHKKVKSILIGYFFLLFAATALGVFL